MNDQQCPSDEQLPEDYLTGFNAVKAELCARFGPDNGVVNYSPIPLYLDPERGLAESLSFSGYVAGVACCTCPLSLYPQQKRGPDGFYELMMCTREPSPFAAHVIGRLAPYSFQAVLKPGDTIDVGPEQSPGSTMRGLLCAKPDMSPPVFRLFGRDCTVLLLMGITAEEMAACRKSGSAAVLAELRKAGAFPFTRLDRPSVV